MELLEDGFHLAETRPRLGADDEPVRSWLFSDDEGVGEVKNMGLAVGGHARILGAWIEPVLDDAVHGAGGGR